MSGKPLTRLTHQAYTIGWICALPIEGGAASFMLDEEHADLVNPGSDTNAYWLGSINGHNVAIACLPSGSYGNNSAATVATRMISTFPNIKVGLMVGIGGGIPSNVRLGDVVISQSKNGHNAVVQWDMGKTEEGGKFRRTGALNNPPTVVMTALSKFQANPIRSRQKIEACLKGLESREDAKAFLKSDSMQDPLDATRGTHDTMQIHYGLIASGNQVIKDAATRDRLNADYGGDLLCFEMEAAGLMNDFPCLVIRGICDYADEHKNKVWQEYAAVVAAACAKSFLSVLPNYHDSHRDWHENNGASVGGNGGPYNDRPRLNDPQTKRALLQAVESGDIAFVEKLLRDGADPDMRDSSGSTLLWIAARNGHMAVVQLLLQHPVDDSILLAVVEAGTCDGRRRDELVRLLISHGALGATPGSDEYSSNRDDQELDWWRNTLVGEWAGSYNHMPASVAEPMGFQVGKVFREAPSALRKGLILFSGSGQDMIAPFVIYGQVMPGRTVRFVKLYPDFGWTYHGGIMGGEGGGWRLAGQWGKQFSGPPGGYFMLESWARNQRTLY